MSAGPWKLRQEYVIDQAMESLLGQSTDSIRKMRPVASPQQLFPKRTGFTQNSWTVEEVLNIDRRTPTYRSWVSGMPVMPSVLSDYSWSGTARNAMTEGTF